MGNPVPFSCKLLLLLKLQAHSEPLELGVGFMEYNMPVLRKKLAAF